MLCGIPALIGRILERVSYLSRISPVIYSKRVFSLVRLSVSWLVEVIKTLEKVFLDMELFP